MYCHNAVCSRVIGLPNDSLCSLAVVPFFLKICLSTKIPRHGTMDLHPLCTNKVLELPQEEEVTATLAHDVSGDAISSVTDCLTAILQHYHAVKVAPQGTSPTEESCRGMGDEEFPPAEWSLMIRSIQGPGNCLGFSTDCFFKSVRMLATAEGTGTLLWEKMSQCDMARWCGSIMISTLVQCMNSLESVSGQCELQNLDPFMRPVQNSGRPRHAFVRLGPIISLDDVTDFEASFRICLLYTSPSPRD